MSDKKYLDPNQDDSDNFVEEEDDQSYETEDLSNVVSKSRNQAADCNVSSEREYHRIQAESSEDLGHKRKPDTTDSYSMKPTKFFSGTRQQQNIHFDITNTPSNKAESEVPRFLPVSVIRHTRDEPLHIASPPENATPELINEIEDDLQAGSSLNDCDDAHVAGPSHYRSQLDRRYAMHSEERSWETREQKLFLESLLGPWMPTNSGQNEYKCDQCPKICSKKADFVKHYRIHTGDKPYKCEKCGRRFSNSSNRNRHRKNCKYSAKAD